MLLVRQSEHQQQPGYCTERAKCSLISVSVRLCCLRRPEPDRPHHHDYLRNPNKQYCFLLRSQAHHHIPTRLRRRQLPLKAVVNDVSLDCWPKHRFDLVRSRFRLQSCPRCFHFLKRFSKNFSLSKLKRPVLLPLPYRYFWQVGVEMSRPPHPFFLVSSSMELFRILSQ